MKIIDVAINTAAFVAGFVATKLFGVAGLLVVLAVWVVIFTRPWNDGSDHDDK